MLVRALPHMTDVPVSLVGGAVRDALLGVRNGEDLDLVVEGDALALAERLGRALNVRVVSHGRFGTAYLELPHEHWIDIVMARREHYAHPGALPDVEPGDLADDLARRDFTINAMAYRLTGRGAGELVDPHGGRSDLAAGTVRALRADSFSEDPTRLIRAARYGARLGFRLDGDTHTSARAAAHAADVASARVGEELKRLLGEASAASAVAILADIGVPWVSPDWERLPARFAAVDAALRQPGAPRIEPWAVRLGLAVRVEALPRVAVDGWARGIAAEAAQGAGLVDALRGLERRSQLDEALSRAKPAAAVVALAEGAEPVADWWAATRDMRLAISGEDLVAAGVRPGPAIGRALRAVRAALLDGHVPDDADAQLGFALRVVGEEPP